MHTLAYHTLYVRLWLARPDVCGTESNKTHYFQGESNF